MGELTLTADITSDLDQLVQQGVAAIVEATAAMARELRETHIPDEAPTGPSGALSSDWQERELDPLTRIVFPGDDAWYAHIVSRGRGTVEPTRAKALTIAGEFRAHAGPTAPNPFDERAVAALEGRADELMVEALSAGGL